MTTVLRQAAALEAVLRHIRPAVRRERPYHVGGLPDVAVKLNQNESPYDLPDDLKRAVLEAFMEIPFNRYPTEQPDRLRHALARRLEHDPDGLLLSNGSNELTYTLGLALVEAGTPVVLPRPLFSLYETMVRLFGGKVVGVPPRPDLHFDADALVAAVERHRPALTVLASPNNPTGLAMPLADIERLAAAAEGFVVVDEAYVEFNDEPSARHLLDTYPNVLVMRTFSKAFGLAGLRVGYLMGHPAVVAELLKARLPFMVDRLAETVALALLERPELVTARVAELKASRQALTQALQAIEGVEVLPSQANFVLFRTPLEPRPLMARLAGKGVLVRDMSGYPELPGYLRVNAGTPAENKAFLGALKEALHPT
ncbi:histidinol-phosphate transaminase [Rhodocaloribacter litoris]|uniref:histidinol-phosphate transaminase n=1 Tax=Rhodocaloribacter litoris TaxID=2558931 RepID=UPI0014221845|nr:histidinol-phosphate transaminase [Rhodocaloribacter litoris]QXD14439.1 histidinol-phosphate transaminase [Rhodocaloribacter litoris]